MTTSTVNPNIPPFQGRLDSAPIRNNFIATFNDINALWTALANAGGTRLRQVTAAGDIDVLTADTGIGVENNVSADVAVNLLPADNTNGHTLVIKDVLGNASSHPITVTPDGAETIDGQSTYVIGADYGWVTLAPVTGGYSVIG